MIRYQTLNSQSSKQSHRTTRFQAPASNPRPRTSAGHFASNHSHSKTSTELVGNTTSNRFPFSCLLCYYLYSVNRALKVVPKSPSNFGQSRALFSVHWWKLQEDKYPALAKLARKIFRIPGHHGHM